MTVAVLTYRRPEHLAELLPLLAEQAERAEREASGRRSVRILVVDNDPGATGADAVRRLADPRVQYVVEPRPGIAAARNRVLAESTSADVVVSLDDDERPHPGWLANLLRLYEAAGAAAVAGVVVPEFDRPPAGLVSAGGFFSRPRHPTGTRVCAAGAGNLLLDVSTVRRLGLGFDTRFGTTGGEDTLFTRAMTQAGEDVIWCDDAVVTDRVPASRATARWVLRRGFRSGNTAGRIGLEFDAAQVGMRRARRRSVRSGVLRCGLGLTRWVIGCATLNPVHRARGLHAAARGLGTAAAGFGHAYEEYRRA